MTDDGRLRAEIGHKKHKNALKENRRQRTDDGDFA
jgi:hypothetical protein